MVAQAGSGAVASEHASSLATCRHVHALDDPYDYTNKYNTPLTPADRKRDSRPGASNRRPSGADATRRRMSTTHDMRGFWKSGGQFGTAGSGHASATRSRSRTTRRSRRIPQYHGTERQPGRHMGRRSRTDSRGRSRHPRPTYKQVHDPGDLQRYFQQVEPGNQLILPQSGGRTP